MRNGAVSEAREMLFGERDGVVEGGHRCLLLSLPRLRGRVASEASRVGDCRDEA
jgi:hypothetical protein